MSEVHAALRIIGAVARADGMITDSERSVFSAAVADFKPPFEDGKTVEDLLSGDSDLAADLLLVTTPVVRKAVFDIAFSMSVVDGATREEGDVLKQIRSAFAITGSGNSTLDQVLLRSAGHPAVAPTLDADERASRVKYVLAKRMLHGAILGALPIPFVSDVGVLIQVSGVIDDIAILWGQPLTTKDKVARFGAILSIAMAQSAAHSLLKMIPGWGSVAGGVSGAIGAYVVVGAVGRAVNYHFERDGKATAAELRKVFNDSKSELKKAYAADKAKVETASTENADAIATLSKQLEKNEITMTEYEQKLEALMKTAA